MTLKNVPEIRIFTSDSPVSRTSGMKNSSLIIKAMISQTKRTKRIDIIGFKVLIQGRGDLFFIVEFVLGELSANKI